MATHASILAWKIPRTEEPGELEDPCWGQRESDMTEHTYTHMQWLKTTEFIFLRVLGARACKESGGLKSRDGEG